MLDELRDLFLKALMFDGENGMPLVNEWIDAIKRVQRFFDSTETKMPVRHGQWIVTAEFPDCVYAQCDQCEITQVFYYNKPLTNYCPNCGARMEGK